MRHTSVQSFAEMEIVTALGDQAGSYDIIGIFNEVAYLDPGTKTFLWRRGFANPRRFWAVAAKYKVPPMPSELSDGC